MEDLAVVLKTSLLQALYKKKNETATVKDRLEKMNDLRKTARNDLRFVNRKIPKDLTPIASPFIVKTEQNQSKMTNPAPNKRLEMLAKWKADKEKRKLEEKKRNKPLFKVTHIPVNVGLPNLEMVNKQIKGKTINNSKFAPANHKFKPPSNIKPIKLNTQPPIVKPTKVNPPQPLPQEKRVTRSQTRQISSTISTQNKTKQKIVKKSDPKVKKQGKQKIKLETKPPTVETTEKNVNLNETMSPDFPIVNLNKEETTPSKIETPPVYISPFVTMSRGKNSARKEYEARRSRKSFMFNGNDCTSPKAGAAYFTWQLDNQISRLQNLCDEWSKYKSEETLPEEAVSVIDVAIGQTNLLITKKFVQFQGLIDRCKNGDTITPVTCEDLHGFWDMIYIQVNNLDKRFENLEKLKTNNWIEIVPEIKIEKTKRRGKIVKTAKASAGLRNAIEAARKKKQNEKIEENETSKTPQTKSRVSLLVSSDHKSRRSSPGLMMMKVAQYAKEVETPSKSILKSVKKSATKSHSKTVLFLNDMDDHVDRVENDFNKLNLQTKEKTPTRRSSRLCKNKLF